MIPKTIHYCWLSGDPYPPLVQKCIESWKTQLPDYEIILWDTHKIDIAGNKWLKQAYEAKKYAFAADYIRLYAIYTHGGIYLDSDVELLGSFDKLLHERSFIGFDSSGDMEPAVFGAEANTGWVKHCLDYYENRTFINEKGFFDQKPLPMIVMQRMEDYFGIKPEPQDNKIVKISSEMIICPSEYFSPKNYYTKKMRVSPNTIAIHHFDGNWVKQGLISWVKLTTHKLLYAILGENGHFWVIKKIRKLND